MSSAGRTSNSRILRCLHNWQTVLAGFLLVTRSWAVVRASQPCLAIAPHSFHKGGWFRAFATFAAISETEQLWAPVGSLEHLYRCWDVKDPHWTGSAKGVPVVPQFQTRMDVFFLRQCYFVGHFPSNLCHGLLYGHSYAPSSEMSTQSERKPERTERSRYANRKGKQMSVS